MFPSAALAPPVAYAAPAEFRGVWVASVINLDYPSAPGLSAAALKREADSILNGALEMGFTAVLFQVRPTGDALYRSSVFPWSDVLTGTQGKEPPDGFDPLAYFTEGAHERGMELHAWINPYRVARNAAGTSGLSADNPAAKNPSWTVSHTDGHLYYNPGIPEVLELVLDGVREIVENYAVDGIHYDDYFYPGKTFDDDAAFKKYGAGFSGKDEWRRGNINKLIRETQAIVHKTRKGCRFGVAPQAIWANRNNNPLGSDTLGFETLTEQFADSRRWVTEGWVDYIAPQIYWEIGRENADYSKVLEWWASLVRGTRVDLYTGHATYLMNGNSARAAWSGTEEIGRQIGENAKHPEVKGHIHFRYKLIAGDGEIAAAVRRLYPTACVSDLPVITTVMTEPPHGTFAVGRPDRDVTFNGTRYYFTGSSDPGQKLTVNGAEIKGRTAKGYFSHYAELKAGENTFTFKQGGGSITRVISVPSGSGGKAPPRRMAAPGIEPGAFPDAYDEIGEPGSVITLSCVAPIGSSVTVRIGGLTLPMTPEEEQKPEDGGIYATVYTAVYTFPDVSSSSMPLLTAGKPVYTMTMDGSTVSRSATGSLRISTGASKLIAEVTGKHAFVFPGPTVSGGPSGELSRGQKGAVTALRNGLWVKLECGLWVLRSDVRLSVRQTKLQGRATGAEYQIGDRWDTLTVGTDIHTAAQAVWEGGALVFTVYNSDSAPALSLPGDALIGRARAAVSDGAAVYTLTPAPGLEIDGFYIQPVQEGLRLYIKRKPMIKAGNRPLEGFSIVVDAGHGGADTGAYGPHGAEYAEKYVNLYAALKLSGVLKELGASVYLTRATDSATPLHSRLNASRAIKPDLFVSLHCNSMSEDVDSDPIRGVVTLYRDAGSAGFAQHIYDYLRPALEIEGRSVLRSNLYVCRGTWAPSVLIEMGFLNNPHDYERLTDDQELNRTVRAIAGGIVDYFRR
jgi:uncharacterized lipoprotein YddW (UPF0748 family)/N-acetylmuramoyl-L-alanine amidase